MTYLGVNALVLAGVLIIAAVLLRRAPRRGTLMALMALTAATVSAFTAVFDSLMIAAGLFRYAPSHLVGLHVGLAPIEDFAYVILAAVLLPALWIGLPEARTPTEKEGA